MKYVYFAYYKITTGSEMTLGNMIIEAKRPISDIDDVRDTEEFIKEQFTNLNEEKYKQAKVCICNIHLLRKERKPIKELIGRWINNMRYAICSK